MKQEGTGRRDEIVGILLLSLAILILTSLLSYTPWDPSLNVAAHPGRALKAENLAGKIGAYLSEGLVDVLGLCAYLLPLLIFFFSLSFFLHREVKQKGIRLLGFLGVLLTSSIILDLFMKPGKDGLWKAGGILGHFLSRFLREYLNTPGTYIIAITFLCISAVISAEISLIKVLSLSWAGVKLGGASAGKLLRRIGLLIVILRERMRREKERERITSKISLKEEPFDSILVHPARKTTESRQEKKKTAEQPSLFELRGKYNLPTLNLLDPSDKDEKKKPIHDEEALRKSSAILAKKLIDFGVEGKVTAVHPGPVITLYEVEPATGVKVHQIANLSDCSAAGKQHFSRFAGREADNRIFAFFRHQLCVGACASGELSAAPW